jgi:hypothetical protein
MNATQFDQLTRAVGALLPRQQSRREVLMLCAKGLALTFLSRPVDLMRPRRVLAQTSDGRNIVTGTCGDLHARETSPGVYCPDGTPLAGVSGCAQANVDPTRTDNNQPQVFRQAHEWCATWSVSIQFTLTAAFTRLHWLPDASPSSTACAPDLERWRTALDAHEQQHLTDAQNITQSANAFWTSQTFTQCAQTKKQAEANLRAATTKSLEDYVLSMITQFNALDASGAGHIPLPTCVDLMSDPQNCGACGKQCGPVGCETCQAGVCTKQTLVPCTTCDANGNVRTCNACEHCDASGNCVSNYNSCYSCVENSNGTTTVTSTCGPCEGCSSTDMSGHCVNPSCVPSRCWECISEPPCVRYLCPDPRCLCNERDGCNGCP